MKISQNKSQKVLRLGLCLSGIKMAQAVCPIPEDNEPGIVLSVVDSAEGIYFCKQDFTQAQMTQAYTAQQLSDDLNADGTAVFSMGDATGSDEIDTTSVTLSKNQSAPFSTVNRPRRYYPDNGGAYSFASLFNFYTRIGSTENCYDNSDNQYEKIIAYLRSHPDIFVATTPNGGTQYATTPANTTNASGGRVAYYVHLQLQEEGGTNLIRTQANFIRANSGGGQYFTRAPYRYCWVSVKLRSDIRTNQNNSFRFKKSGDYSVSIGVLTE